MSKWLGTGWFAAGGGVAGRGLSWVSSRADPRAWAWVLVLGVRVSLQGDYVPGVWALAGSHGQGRGESSGNSARVGMYGFRAAVGGRSQG